MDERQNIFQQPEFVWALHQHSVCNVSVALIQLGVISCPVATPPNVLSARFSVYSCSVTGEAGCCTIFWDMSILSFEPAVGVVLVSAHFALLYLGMLWCLLPPPVFPAHCGWMHAIMFLDLILNGRIPIPMGHVAVLVSLETLTSHTKVNFFLTLEKTTHRFGKWFLKWNIDECRVQSSVHRVLFFFCFCVGFFFRDL